MKRCLRKIAVALMAVMLFSALAGYAYAANTSLKEFTHTSYAGIYLSVGDHRGKTDSSAMVINIDSSSVGSTHNVRAIGQNYAGNAYVNCTLYNNQDVDYVVCGEGTYYGIQNTVREHGYGYATLMVSHGAGYGTVSGKWAPDSAQSYASPSAP